MSEYHAEFMHLLGKSMAEYGKMEMPPRITEELRPRFLDHVPNKALICVFPAQPRFANPMGLLQGGILASAFDFVFGAMAFLTAARPCTSVTMNLTFIRPLPADDKEFTIDVRLRALTRNMIFLEGKALDAGEKTVATAMMTMQVLKGER